MSIPLYTKPKKSDPMIISVACSIYKVFISLFSSHHDPNKDGGNQDNGAESRGVTRSVLCGV